MTQAEEEFIYDEAIFTFDKLFHQENLHNFSAQ